MKNKRILKQSLFILLGFVILALYIYTKRLDSQKTNQINQNSTSEVTNESVNTQEGDLLTPEAGTIKAPSSSNGGGGIPAPKPAN